MRGSCNSEPLTITKITDAGIEPLTDLQNLKCLFLWKTKVTDLSIFSLSRLQKLQVLDISQTLITQKAFQTLQDKLPNCLIHYWYSWFTGLFFSARYSRSRGYVSQKLAFRLLAIFWNTIFCKTPSQHNIKNKFIRLHNKLLYRKRSIIQIINDQLQNISQIEHSRHRSPTNFCVNVLCGMIADLSST